GSFSRNLAGTWNAIVRSLWNLEKPVVAAVNGPAVGAGIAAALACDLVLASDRATFVGAFDKLGFIPDAGLTWAPPAPDRDASGDGDRLPGRTDRCPDRGGARPRGPG